MFCAGSSLISIMELVTVNTGEMKWFRMEVGEGTFNLKGYRVTKMGPLSVRKQILWQANLQVKNKTNPSLSIFHKHFVSNVN